jgi:hypothetical protein
MHPQFFPRDRLRRPLTRSADKCPSSMYASALSSLRFWPARPSKRHSHRPSRSGSSCAIPNWARAGRLPSSGSTVSTRLPSSGRTAVLTILRRKLLSGKGLGTSGHVPTELSGYQREVLSRRRMAPRPGSFCTLRRGDDARKDGAVLVETDSPHLRHCIRSAVKPPPLTLHLLLQRSPFPHRR